jgi:cytochrome P450
VVPDLSHTTVMSSDEGSGMEALLERVDLTGSAAPPSPAGAISAEEAASLPAPPAVPLARHLQILRFNQRQIEFVFKAQRKLGDVWGMRAYRDRDVVTSHPDHVRSLFTATPEDAPSITGESPLRPIVGPNSVLTAIGSRHMRQRKLLLPPFHGEAIERYGDCL